jgi:hypothetical protein
LFENLRPASHHPVAVPVVSRNRSLDFSHKFAEMRSLKRRAWTGRVATNSPYTQEAVRVLKEILAAITGSGRIPFTADQRHWELWWARP